jgi:hypothetical protein
MPAASGSRADSTAPNSRGLWCRSAAVGTGMYVPGGLRSSAGVAVGDTVVVEVDGRTPDDVRPPADLAAALAAAPEVAEAFFTLSPAHRRELVRWLEDARTPATRQRRVAQVLDRALGRTVPNPGVRTARPLWTCPECGQSFVTVRPRLRWLDVEFWLPRRVESARLRKVETLSPYTHIHVVRITTLGDLDDELIGWLREAYAVGRQDHLRQDHLRQDHLR